MKKVVNKKYETSDIITIVVFVVFVVLISVPYLTTSASEREELRLKEKEETMFKERLLKAQEYTEREEAIKNRKLERDIKREVMKHHGY